MRIESSGIVNGILLDKYGKRGIRVNGTGMPTLSFPLNIVDAPIDAKSFAIIFDDPDSVAVCGFTWLHWLCITTKNSLEENASVTDKSLVQGTNSWGKSAYGGMAPPDRPHTYICKVYALDFVPNLKEGFTLDNLQEVMQNHILAECKIEGLYNN